MAGIISVCLELAQRCRVGCPYCLMEEKGAEGNFNDWRRIVRTLADEGVCRFTLGGAEPLAVPYLYDLAQDIKDVGGNALLRTSGCVPIDTNVAAKLFSVIDISIDSNCKEVLDVCKPNIDSAIVFRNIEMLVACNANLRINVLITQYNYVNIAEFISFLAALGVRVIRLQRFVRRGKAKAVFRDFEITDAEFDATVRQAEHTAKECNVTVSVLSTVTEETLCIIKPDGRVYRGNPSGIIFVGNVNEEGTLNHAAHYLGSSQLKHYGHDLGLL